MPTARFMNRPEDFKKIGIKPDVVERWEAGRRDTDAAGHNEVWYFDAAMNDGTKVILGFRPKTLEGFNSDRGSPNCNIVITTPDGQSFQDLLTYSPEESSMARETCNIKFGPHSVVGDLKQYDVAFAPVNGVGAQLHYECLVKPYRFGGTAYVALGDNDEYYYTDMSIPKSRVTGTVTVKGKTYAVEGFGYHDHQWMNIHAFQAWHHWLWGRMYAGEYTLVIYDFVATERFGFTRIPVLGILDAKGDVIFDNSAPVKCEIDLYLQKETQKPQPKVSRYTFNDHGKKVELTIEWVDEIEVRNIYGKSPDAAKANFDKMGLQPTYVRYYAKGRVVMTEGEKSTAREGTMIYEYAYFGRPDDRAHLPSKI